VATYAEWNRALFSYIVTGLQRGSSVFLHVDDDVLQQVAQMNVASDPAFGESCIVERDDAVKDFCQSVRDQALDATGSVNLRRLRGLTGEEVPGMLAFLAALVLAATHMADEEEISQNNYFKRLREILGLPSAEGRPPGMDVAGSEEFLWLDWARWLQQHDFLPTARHGEGPMRYISYPISQALLRRADKNRLRALYREKHWRADWDIETLMARIRHELSSLPQHLRQIVLTTGDPQRLQGLGDAVYEIYESWRDNPRADGADARSGNPPSTLLAGLYRTEDPFNGDVFYHLYPRQRRRYGGTIILRYQGSSYPLSLERPGWFQPLDALDPAQLDAGIHLPIEQPGELHQLVLPQRLFWILVPDPESPDSGIYGSWGPPPLGVHFILLCKRELLPQLEHMRGEHLLDWTGPPRPLAGTEQWVELHHCAIVSQAWSGVFIENADLFDALQPKVSLDIALTGGLRAPKAAAWLEDHGPEVAVAGFSSTTEMRVVAVVDDREVVSETVSTNTPVVVPWPGPGNYRVEALCGKEIATRLIRIVSWHDLRITPEASGEALDLGDVRLRGAVLETVPQGAS